MQVFSRRAGSGLLATAAVVATLALGTPAAQSTTRHHPDASKDVTEVTYGADGSVTTAQDPDKVDGDIVALTMWHRHRIGVTVGFAELKRFGVKLEDVRMVTDAGVKRDAVVVAADGYWRGEGWVERPNGNVVSGCSLSKLIDYTANTVTISVSRKCLAYPRWVRIGFMDYDLDDLPSGTAKTLGAHPRALAGEPRALAGEDQVTYIDDAMKDDGAGDLVANLSEPIRRQ